MFLFVICFNLSLTALNSYLAVRLWLSYGELKRLTKTLIRLERCSHRFLAPTPPRWRSAQQGVHQSRLGYQRLAKQLWLLQNVIRIIGVFGKLNQSSNFTQNQKTIYATFAPRRSPKT